MHFRPAFPLEQLLSYRLRTQVTRISCCGKGHLRISERARA